MREPDLTFAQRVRSGERLLGSFAFLPSPGVVEILGRAGMDFVIIDQEHSRKSWETVENMVRAAEVSGMAALVRVANIEEKEILHALEVGAAGIMVPFVETADDVRRASSALRYAPDGTRGTCTQTRAANYGAERGRFVDYAKRRNNDLLLIGLIESHKGLDNIASILSVDQGLDVVFIGRSDLASDMGKPGQSGDPVVEAASERIVICALKAGKRVGVAQYTPAECELWASRGCSFLALPSESGFLLEAFSSLRIDVDTRWNALANHQGCFT